MWYETIHYKKVNGASNTCCRGSFTWSRITNFQVKDLIATETIKYSSYHYCYQYIFRIIVLLECIDINVF